LDLVHPPRPRPDERRAHRSASYYKERGIRPAELYEEALGKDKIVSHLLRNATAEGTIRSTKDWSFLASRLSGGNWFLCGESAGFADPILAAGLTLAHKGARDLAYTILELDKGEIEDAWLRSSIPTRTGVRLASTSVLLTFGTPKTANSAT